MKPTQSDRTVHAVLVDGSEVVRYDRAGKWFSERDDLRPVKLTLASAVRLASQVGARAYLGRSGGRRFDAGVRNARTSWDAIQSDLKRYKNATPGLD